MNILAIDPGGTTGLAWCPTEVLVGGNLDSRFAEIVSMGQIEGTVPEQATKIAKGMGSLATAIVISESSDHFLLAGAGRGSHSLIPIKLNGAISAMVAIMNWRWDDAIKRGVVKEQLHHQGWTQSCFVEQTPGQAKGVVKDAVIKAMGFDGPIHSERHQYDALRHLILFIRRYQESMKAKTGFHEVFKEALS